MKKLKLGRKISPPEALPNPVLPSDNDQDEMSYPSVHLHDIKHLDKFPDEGHAVVKYKIRHRSANKENDEPVKHSAEMELHTMEPHTPGPRQDKSSFGAKHAMDNLLNDAS